MIFIIIIRQVNVSPEVIIGVECLPLMEVIQCSLICVRNLFLAVVIVAAATVQAAVPAAATFVIKVAAAATR